MERVLSRFGGIFYAAMRVVLALIYMAHGVQKVFGMFGGHAVLHRAFRDAVRWNRLAVNPATQADPPSGTNQRPQLSTWTAEQLTARKTVAGGGRRIAHGGSTLR